MFVGIDKDILNRLNEQNIKVFTINDIIDLGSYDNLRKNDKVWYFKKID